MAADGPNPPTTAADPAPPPSGRPATGWWIGAALIAIVLGVGGYLIGHSAGESSERDNFDAGAPGYQAIYEEGVAAGKEQGTQQGQAQGQAQGAAKGEKAGLEQGEQQGKQQGVAEGTKVGADAALGGFDTWEPGAPYVVKVETGSDAVPYQISSRTQMKPDTDYALCQDAPTTVCTVEEK